MSDDIIEEDIIFENYKKIFDMMTNKVNLSEFKSYIKSIPEVIRYEVLDFYDDNLDSLGIPNIPPLLFASFINFNNLDYFQALIDVGANPNIQIGNEDVFLFIINKYPNFFHSERNKNKLGIFLSLQKNHKEYIETLYNIIDLFYSENFWINQPDIKKKLDMILNNELKVDDLVYAKNSQDKWKLAKIKNIENITNHKLYFIEQKETENVDLFDINENSNIIKVNEDFKDLEKIYEKSEIKNLEIDENMFLDMKCEDIFHQKTRNNSCYFDNDDASDDNILIIYKDGDKYFIDCYKRSYLKNQDITKIKYPCHQYNFKGREINDTTFNPINYLIKKRFYKVDLSFGTFYIDAFDLKLILEDKNKIFYLEKETEIKIPRTVSEDVIRNQNVVSGSHCQTGTEIKVYKVNVCGGEKCLKDIFS